MSQATEWLTYEALDAWDLVSLQTPSPPLLDRGSWVKNSMYCPYGHNGFDMVHFLTQVKVRCL